MPLSEINSGNWDSVTRRAESATTGAATRDTNALKFIALSDSKTIWITFHRSRMWWCQLAAGAVEMDELSKFRRAKGEWSDSDARGAPLLTNALPGVLTQIQGFRGTVCRVKDRTMPLEVSTHDEVNLEGQVVRFRWLQARATMNTSQERRAA